MTLLKLSFTRHFLECEREAIKADIAWLPYSPKLYWELRANEDKLNAVLEQLRQISAEREP